MALDGAGVQGLEDLELQRLVGTHPNAITHVNDSIHQAVWRMRVRIYSQFL